MAYDDYDAGLKGETIGHDTFSYAYQLGARERERQAASSGGAGGLAGASGGGIVLVAVLVIVSFIAFVLAICTYPFAGIVTGIAFGIGVWLLNGDGHNTMNGVGLVFALMVPCYIVYRLAIIAEHKIAQHKIYRIFRTLWRIAAYTYIAHALGTGLHMENGKVVLHDSFMDYILHVLMVVVAFFGSYWNSVRLDYKYNLEPVRLKWIDSALNAVLSRMPWSRRKRGSARTHTVAGSVQTASYEPASSPQPTKAE